MGGFTGIAGAFVRAGVAGLATRAVLDFFVPCDTQSKTGGIEQFISPDYVAARANAVARLDDFGIKTEIAP